MRDALNVQAEAARSSSPYLRRDLRIGIRQVERAELYVAAVLSLELGDEHVEEAVGGLIEDLRQLRTYLLTRRITA